MRSLRARLLIALLAVVAVLSVLAGLLTYRRVLAETSTLFDYQLRQMALTLGSQIPMAPRLELPPDQSDFVIQIWDVYGTRVYFSRPGLPLINATALGYADVTVGGQAWRTYGLQTVQGVIQIAQPVQVRESLARGAALRVVIPLLLLLPLLGAAVVGVVGSGLRPLRRVASEVQRRDVHSLTPIAAARLPHEIAPLVNELNRLLMRLDAAFQTQRAFVADAAHELRSPLTALSLELQLLDRAPDEEARREALANLKAAAARAIHLVEQMLTLARNEPREPRRRARHGCPRAGGCRRHRGCARARRRAPHRPFPGSGTGHGARRPGGVAHAGSQPRRQRRALHAAGRERPGADATRRARARTRRADVARGGGFGAGDCPRRP